MCQTGMSKFATSKKVCCTRGKLNQRSAGCFEHRRITCSTSNRKYSNLLKWQESSSLLWSDIFSKAEFYITLEMTMGCIQCIKISLLIECPLLTCIQTSQAAMPWTLRLKPWLKLASTLLHTNHLDCSVL